MLAYENMAAKYKRISKVLAQKTEAAKYKNNLRLKMFVYFFENEQDWKSSFNMLGAERRYFEARSWV